MSCLAPFPPLNTNRFQVYAFYNKRKSLFVFLFILSVAKHAVTVYIFVVSGSHVVPLPVSLGTGRCLLLSANKVFVNYWLELNLYLVDN